MLTNTIRRPLISTGIIFYADGLKNIYRRDQSLHEPVFGQLSSLQVLFERFRQLKRISGFALAVPDSEEFAPLCHIAQKLDIDICRFAINKVVEKPLWLRQQRWFLEDDTGNETWVGAAFYNVAQKFAWNNLILMPVTNLLIESRAVMQSLELHQREDFDFCTAGERQPGAGWTIFKSELLIGMQKSHEELMWVRGGLAWALLKPLYPFKSGIYHCPRIRPAFTADLRLNSLRSRQMYLNSRYEKFASQDFSYEEWLKKSAWEKYYTDFGPQTIYFEPSSHCQAACISCPYAQIAPAHQHYSFADFEKLLAQFDPDSEVRWVFSGMGEPLLNPDISKMVTMMKNFSTMLITSLQRPFSEEFPFSALDQIRVSVDSLEPEGFAQNRPDNEWKHIEQFLKFSAESKKADPSGFPEVGVTFVRHALNEIYIQAFLRYWKKVCTPVFASNFFRWPFDTEPDQVQWYQILGESSYLGVRQRTASVDLTPYKRRACRHVLLSATIRANGDMTICPWNLSQDYVLGNVNNKPFAEIWNSEIAREFRARQIDMNLAEPCNNCRDWYHNY